MRRFMHECFKLYSCVMLVFIQSQADDEMTPPFICTTPHSHASLSDPTPPLPTLPLQYSMKVEANIIQNGWTTEVEEHYDNINQRASVSLTFNGSTTISIFNFETNRRYDIYPNGSCVGKANELDYFGFMTKSKHNRPVMATVNDVFRFGRQFNVTYVAKETVRGVPVNHWTSCQTWAALGAKFQIDYYFSDPDYTTASGRTEIPVRAVLNGSAHNVDTSNGEIKGTHSFRHIYEFTSFRAGPMLNEEVFQIPPGIFCSGLTDKKPLPQIPDQLEMFLEIVVPERNTSHKQQILRYALDHGLQEVTTTRLVNASAGITETPSNKGQISNNSLDLASTQVVRDYNSGLVFSTDMTTMKCSVQKMPPAMITSQSQHLLAPVNASDKFEYQGQRKFRQMLVDVWSMEQGGVTSQVYFLPQIGTHQFQSMVGIFIKNRTSVNFVDLPMMIRDIVFSANTSLDNSNNADSKDSSSSSSSSNPAAGDQLTWGAQLERLLDMHTSQMVANIFQYNRGQLGPGSFQVSHCYHKHETSEITIYILANYHKEVHSNYLEFSNSLRNAIARNVGVSLLHVSNLDIVPYKIDIIQDEVTKAVFTLLGAAPVEDTKQIPLNRLIDNLKLTINEGITFQVAYSTYSKEFGVYKHSLLYNHNTSHTSRDANSSCLGTGHSAHASSDFRYSQAIVAGIATSTFILGALLCLGITFLMYSRNRVRESLISQEDSI